MGGPFIHHFMKAGNNVFLGLKKKIICIYYCFLYINAFLDSSEFLVLSILIFLKLKMSVPWLYTYAGCSRILHKSKKY